MQSAFWQLCHVCMHNWLSANGEDGDGDISNGNDWDSQDGNSDNGDGDNREVMATIGPEALIQVD